MRSTRLVAAVVAFVAATSGAAAGTAAERPPEALAHAVCLSSEPRAVRLAGAADSRSSGPGGLHRYDDHIEDVVTAPDVCAANVVTNDNVTITLGVHVHDRTSFAPADAYAVHLDTDSSPETGAPDGAAPAPGIDHVVDVAAPRSRLRAWTGAAFEPVVPQPEIPTTWIEGYGPVLAVARSALGDPDALRLVLMTTNAGDVDLAPDSDAWSYTVAPLRLTPRGLAVGPARAGTPLHAALVVERSDWETSLDEGAIACRASVLGRTLAGRGRFAAGAASCTWRLPTRARGKRVRGSVAVTFQGETAKRSFAVIVR